MRLRWVGAKFLSCFTVRKIFRIDKATGGNLSLNLIKNLLQPISVGRGVFQQGLLAATNTLVAKVDYQVTRSTIGLSCPDATHGEHLRSEAE